MRTSMKSYGEAISGKARAAAEDFIIRWGMLIPKERREDMVNQLTALMQIVSADAVDTFIEYMRRNSR